MLSRLPRVTLLLRKFQPWVIPIEGTNTFLSHGRLYSVEGQPILDNRDSIKLRPYQEECIDAVLQHLKNGHQRLGISLATGSGKTVIFTQLVDRIPPQNSQATQTLIVAHRRELVEQAARHSAQVYPNKTIDVEMGSTHASGAADITIASIFSLLSGDRLSKFDPQKFKLIIVDEAHHIVAASYMAVLRHFRLLKDDLNNDSPTLVGVSATLSRFDGLRLSDALDHIVYHKDFMDMIQEKRLSNIIFTTVQSKADLSGVHCGSSGDFEVGQLSKAVNTDEINRVTVQAWMERASGRRSTLIFCVDVAHVNSLTSIFRNSGIDARSVTGKTPKNVRHERLDAFRNAEYPVLLNCGIFTEGTDVPNIDCVLLARPTKSKNLLVQMIGRGTRLYPGKTDCHVIDMVASLETGIATIPTLYGLDPDCLLREETAENMQKKYSQEQNLKPPEEPVPPFIGPVNKVKNHVLTFTDYDSVFDLIDDTVGERHIRNFSPHAWVMVGSARYVLSSQDRSYVSIEKQESSEATNFTVMYLRRLTVQAREASKTKSPYARARKTAMTTLFTDAVHAADTFASHRFPRIFIQKNARWRKGPATTAQLDFLNRLRPPKVQHSANCTSQGNVGGISVEVKSSATATPAVEKKFTAENLSRGKAADMMTKITFGAKTWFSELEASKKREARIPERNQRIMAQMKRVEVRVGPLQD